MDSEEKSCQTCEFFYRGSWGSRIDPPEEPECGMYPNIIFLPNWPFKNGCKGYKKREYRMRSSIGMGSE